MHVEYRLIEAGELTLDLFCGFDRTQFVTKCWRKQDGQWVLRDIAFEEKWGEAQYQFLIQCLKNTLQCGGVCWGAFAPDGRLVGFASVERAPFGNQKQYVQLSSLHVSRESRRHGIGRQLFEQAAHSAREWGSAKLYISAHSALETQAFYHAIGCVEAEAYDQKLASAEPCDCQMEFVL